MNDNDKSYTDKFKEDRNKLKERAEELFKEVSPDDEPQSVGDPSKILEDDEDERRNES